MQAIGPNLALKNHSSDHKYDYFWQHLASFSYGCTSSQIGVNAVQSRLRLIQFTNPHFPKHNDMLYWLFFKRLAWALKDWEMSPGLSDLGTVFRENIVFCA